MSSSRPTSLQAPPERRVYCNRTLNFRTIEAIGYDMDYTLIHYKEKAWEQRAYDYLRQKLVDRGWPVERLRFDAGRMTRCLVIDTVEGNIIKANRFGYVKQAHHGTRPMAFEDQRRTYSRTIVELGTERFVFLNTLFSLSEGCIYAQLVDLLDEGGLPGVMGYADLYQTVRRSLDEAHAEGQLKAEIVASPDEYVEADPEVPRALLDQRQSGKALLLITNSEWRYTREMMRYAFDPHLPRGTCWKDLFDLIIVAARKPSFFSGRAPLLEVVDDEGLLRPVNGELCRGGIYFGGSADQVEDFLGLSGDQILYVGDHIYGDVHVSKSILRWRTALVLRELEAEIAATAAFAPQLREVSRLMDQKEELEYETFLLKLDRQRLKHGEKTRSGLTERQLQRRLARLRDRLGTLDERIGPLARASATVSHPVWGPLMRAGNDKSLLARQVERSADIYTSRVSNLLYQTPFAYLRSRRGSLPHDPGT